MSSTTAATDCSFSMGLMQFVVYAKHPHYPFIYSGLLLIHLYVPHYAPSLLSPVLFCSAAQCRCSIRRSRIKEVWRTNLHRRYLNQYRSFLFITTRLMVWSTFGGGVGRAHRKSYNDWMTGKDCLDRLNGWLAR